MSALAAPNICSRLFVRSLPFVRTLSWGGCAALVDANATLIFKSGMSNC